MIQIIVLIFSIIICVFLTNYLKYFNIELSSITDNTKLKSIPEFSTDIHFDPFADEYDIDAEFECTPTDLRKCDMNNQASCFNCKSFTAKCVHFDKDQTYIDLDGKAHTIQKNLDPNEGYCLTINKLTETCNLYHGDLIFVKISNYGIGLVCHCKNPGFIGNTHLMGNCSDVFVCNGKIKNINVPFEEIECDCDENNSDLIPAKYNNIPICEEPKILNLKKHIPIQTFPLSIASFNKNISGNLVYQKDLPNPCIRCLLTRQVVGIEYHSDDKKTVQCVALEFGYGIPIRLKSNERLLKGEFGPDAILAIHYHEIRVYGKTKQSEFLDGEVIFNNRDGANTEIYKKLNLTDNYKNYSIGLLENDLVVPGNFATYVKFSKTPKFYCEGSWPSYYCYATNGNGPIVNSNEHTVVNTFNARACPGTFLWNREYWEKSEALNPAVHIRKRNNMTEIRMNCKILQHPDAMGMYLIFRQDEIILARASDHTAHKKFLNTLIEFDDTEDGSCK